ncbi:hypothetical protein M426DRAFT_66888, partial [Hypoxylon sp. CI-4A]
IEPLGDVPSIFQYHKEYAMRPSEESQQSWESLFPRKCGHGFVRHPTISPDMTGVAVYHQLHCLDAIRHGYWGARDGLDPNQHSKPGHIRHCIDYLRQSLMCHADTNLEPIDIDLGGVNGFGFPRKCRDFTKVTAWTDKWRTHNETSIS